jgi:hypothetical protein
VRGNHAFNFNSHVGLGLQVISGTVSFLHSPVVIQARSHTIGLIAGRCFGFQEQRDTREWGSGFARVRVAVAPIVPVPKVLIHGLENRGYAAASSASPTIADDMICSTQDFTSLGVANNPSVGPTNIPTSRPTVVFPPCESGLRESDEKNRHQY